MNKLKNLFKRKPKTMDELLYKYGIGSCFRLFPPSFYRKHSPEKAQELREAELTRLRELLEEYKNKHNIEDSE